MAHPFSQWGRMCGVFGSSFEFLPEASHCENPVSLLVILENCIENRQSRMWARRRSRIHAKSCGLSRWEWAHHPILFESYEILFKLLELSFLPLYPPRLHGYITHSKYLRWGKPRSVVSFSTSSTRAPTEVTWKIATHPSRQTDSCQQGWSRKRINYIWQYAWRVPSCALTGLHHHRTLTKQDHIKRPFHRNAIICWGCSKTLARVQR